MERTTRGKPRSLALQMAPCKKPTTFIGWRPGHNPTTHAGRGRRDRRRLCHKQRSYHSRRATTKQIGCQFSKNLDEVRIDPILDSASVQPQETAFKRPQHRVCGQHLIPRGSPAGRRRSPGPPPAGRTCGASLVIVVSRLPAGTTTDCSVSDALCTCDPCSTTFLRSDCLPKCPENPKRNNTGDAPHLEGQPSPTGASLCVARYAPREWWRVLPREGCAPRVLP